MTLYQRINLIFGNRLTRWALLLLCCGFIASTAVAQNEPPVRQGAHTLGGFVLPAIVQIDMAQIPPPRQWQPGDPVVDIPRRLLHSRNTAEAEPRGFGFDPLAAQQNQAAVRGGSGFGTTIINQDGIGFNGMVTADPAGDAGVDFYVQVASAVGPGSDVLIIDKITGATMATFNTLSLTTGSGTGCSTDSTINPLVIFDQSAAGGQGRWVLTEITEDGSICIYISQTTDPTAGTWFIYEFLAVSSGLPDYFKLGAWSDAYYASSNELFELNRPAYAFDRVNMLMGNPARPAQAISYDTLSGFPFQLLQAADADGELPPPAGAPGILLRHNDDESHNEDCAVAGQDCVEVWEFAVDFNNAANSSLSGPLQVPVSEFDSNLCGLTSFACVSQAGSPVLLDPLREPVMWRVQYRNMGDSQRLTGSFVTDVDGNDRHGVRWFILERPVGVTTGGWTLQQEGTFSPDATNRWMSSVALDNLDNLALGFNVAGSDTGVFPGIRYAGRLSDDPQGVLNQGEFSLVEGAMPNITNRYGAYSSLVVDPVDDCTFWFSAQYNPGSNWQTRIGSFQYDSCGAPGFVLGGTPTSQQVCSPGDLQDITVNSASVSGFSNPITLALNGAPAGTSSSFTPNPVSPGNSSLAQISLGAGVPPGMTGFSIRGTAPGATPDNVGVNLQVFTIIPGAPQPVMPANGAVEVNLPVTLSWNAAAQSSSFFIELATDSGFSNVIYSVDETASAHLINTPLESLTTYFWRVTASNPCGGGGTSPVFTFTTREIPPILLVDDDDNIPDTRSFYASTLTSLNVDFDVYDTGNSDTEPSALELSVYDAVIWFTGDEFGGAAGPGGAGEAALADFLTNEGCLLISSQDYYLDRGPPPTPFMADFLGLSGASASDEGDYVSVSGAGGSLFSGLGPYNLDYSLPGITDVSDDLQPAAGAILALAGNNGNGAAVARDEFDSAYLGFPLETLTLAQRSEVIEAFFDQCGGLSFEAFFIDGFED